ncbi:hypothetical protein O181_092841 [Austropuccinia psidii MF-1]|uniref:Uncharacterized protein n=1 Tax=Austropuccinia psidii MF-1 TaxID=1389203 RepID=A0A9Q3J0B9_9BASI|nr:hypothetical protein [Austropuccinia psidii MF-1]
MECTIIQTSKQKYKGLSQQEKGGNQGTSPSRFCQKASSQPASPRRESEQEKEMEEAYSPTYNIPRIQKDPMDNVFNIYRTLEEFKDKEEQRSRQPLLPKKLLCLLILSIL